MRLKKLAQALLKGDALEVIRYIERYRKLGTLFKDKEDVEYRLLQVIKENEILLYPLVFNLSTEQYHNVARISCLIGVKNESGKLVYKVKNINLRFPHFFIYTAELLTLLNKNINSSPAKLSIPSWVCESRLKNTSTQNIFNLLGFKSINGHYELLLFFIKLTNLEIGAKVKEIINDLNGASALIVSHIGECIYLPIHAIKLEQKFLIEHMPVLYSASLNRKINISPNVCLFVDQNIQTNPYSKQRLYEGDMLKNVFKDKALYVNTLKDICSKCLSFELSRHKELSLIHISTHGFYYKNDTYISLNDGLTSLKEVFRKSDFRSDLITLSACNIHLSTIENNSFDNISSPIYNLGKRINNALVTIGPIGVEASKHFMSVFYSSYIKEQNINKSFMLASKHIIARSELDWVFLFPIRLRW